MKFAHILTLAVTLFMLGGCAVFDSGKSAQEPPAIPVGKNWQIVEEPPKLSDDSGRLPFQKEQSVQPEIAKPQPLEKKRTVETPQ